MLPSRHIIQDEVNSWYGEVTNLDARLPGLREALKNGRDDIMQEVDRLSTELIQLLRDAPHAALIRERAFHLSGLGQVQQPATHPWAVTAHPLNVTPAGPVNGFNQQPPPSSSRHGLPPPSGMDDISPDCWRYSGG
ncbi:Exocyst complex component sec6 [Lasiodiplodia theobromae]|uniref:Exocyst complex component sec6 n=1 Tax=Lasiodiplodia theobromae TaxID=45133 RepID=UPI0015C38E44|nr:Exocyst complex component sec6 [Lasiodiplodia theobromae]KAF4544302.1 Exocyst complex component sec6 [Lasiodiplodia theobromae]